MIAYNKTWLGNLAIQDEAEKAFAAQCISAEELAAVKQQYPAGFYRPNIFIRAGLFVLTVVIALCAFGLIALLIMEDSRDPFAGLSIFFGLVSYITLEVMVRNKKHYRSGADDALIWLSGGFIIMGISVLGYASTSATSYALLIFIIAGYLSLRFGRAGTTIVTIVSLLAVVFFALTPADTLVKTATPFVLILVCTLLYLLLKKVEKQPVAKWYPQCVMAANICLLLCFYAAGNYYVVREGSTSRFYYWAFATPVIFMAWFFWCWTIALPLIYIYRGIQKKDAIFLRVGLVLVAVIVFTVRYYHHVLPAEMAMTIGGCVLLSIAYALTRYLRQPRHGYTSLPSDDPHITEKLRIESLLVVQSFGGPAQQPADTGGTQFGGGTGSGGGASGEY